MERKQRTCWGGLLGCSFNVSPISMHRCCVASKDLINFLWKRIPVLARQLSFNTQCHDEVFPRMIGMYSKRCGLTERGRDHCEEQNIPKPIPWKSSIATSRV
eukprot:3252634-Amphidinium_carterae.1